MTHRVEETSIMDEIQGLKVCDWTKLEHPEFLLVDTRGQRYMSMPHAVKSTCVCLMGFKAKPQKGFLLTDVLLTFDPDTDKHTNYFFRMTLLSVERIKNSNL